MKSGGHENIVTHCRTRPGRRGGGGGGGEMHGGERKQKTTQKVPSFWQKFEFMCKQQQCVLKPKFFPPNHRNYMLKHCFTKIYDIEKDAKQTKKMAVIQSETRSCICTKHCPKPSSNRISRKKYCCLYGITNSVMRANWYIYFAWELTFYRLFQSHQTCHV